MQTNIHYFYFLRFLETCVFTTAIWSFFFTDYLHFSFGNGLFLITLTGIVSLLFDIPSWAWADRFWRKKVYVCWTLLLMMEMIIWYTSQNYYVFIFWSILAWIGSAMISWNLEALIHDDINEKRGKVEFKNILASSYIMVFLWRAFATSVSWFLFIIHPLLPVFATFLCLCLISMLVSRMHESKQILSFHISTLSHLEETWKFLKDHKSIGLFIILVSTLSGIWNVFYFTQQPYYLFLWFNIPSIGILFTLWALSSALGWYTFKHISSWFSENQILSILEIMTLLAAGCFVFFTPETAIIWVIVLSLMFGSIMTFWQSYVIERVPKHQKSTILSIFSASITFSYSLSNLCLIFLTDTVSLTTLYQIQVFLIVILLIGTNFTSFRFDR